MEWTIDWGEGLPVQIKLPPGLIAGEALTAEFSHNRRLTFTWYPRQGTLIIQEGDSGLERCLSLRSLRSQRFAGEASAEVDLEVTGRMASVIRAKVSPLAAGESARRSQQAGGVAVVRAPMTGKVLQVLAVKGDPIKAGALIAVIEAMKMENQIFAPRPGRVSELKIKVGELVTVGTELARIDSESPASRHRET